jgi:3'-phosphoadenosine 5'-phosphosulfate sulfotransferase (PAPS reductase)/FAD synthetase
MQAELREKLAGRRVVASISGGKDSAAMSLWLSEQGVEHDRVFADTGWEHPDTYAYLRGPLTEKLGPITEVRGPRTMDELVVHKGMFPSRVRRFCTQELKVFPLAKFVTARAQALECEIVNAVGIRAEESEARAKFAEWEWQETFDCDVWRPILRWSFEDVVAIHKRHGLAPNPLYLRGASRVGCWPCIYARKEEIRLVAEVDPGRIDRIRELERVVGAAQRARQEARAGADGERERERERAERGPARQRRAGFFGLWLHGKGTRACAPIDEVVAWSRTAQGGTNLSLFAPGPPDEGCMRWGLCETTPTEEGKAACT